MSARSRYVFMATALLALAYGLGFVFAPNQIAALYKTDLMNHTGVYNSMLFGGLLITVALLNWMASQSHDEEVIKLITTANLVSSGIGLAITLQRQFATSSAFPSAWLNVGIYLVLFCAFLYLRLSMSRTKGLGQVRGT